VRIVAATNVDLKAMSNQGCFRKDLMFRLQILTVSLPPLRERGGDIELLAEHFLQQFSARYKQGRKTLHPETLEWMRTYGWSGNVRELGNLLNRYYLLTEGSLIRIPAAGAYHDGDVAAGGERNTRREMRFRESKARAIAAFERSYLRSLLSETDGNISLAARLAGKDRTALRRLLQKHGLRKGTFSQEG
jgi:DNA-binding NtrC family response regulator